MKITSEVFQVGGGNLTAPGDASIYLINVDGRAALVDAGCGRSEDRLLKNIKYCGVDPETIEYLLITHCHFDHTGGAKSLKERLGLEIVAHELDAHFLEEGNKEVTAASWYGSRLVPFYVDIKLKGAKERITLNKKGIDAIHVPGHSPGSVVYLVESDGKRILFGQDVHGPLHPSLLSNEKDYQNSLSIMLSLEADILCEGHFGIYRGRQAVAEFISSFITYCSNS